MPGVQKPSDNVENVLAKFLSQQALQQSVEGNSPAQNQITSSRDLDQDIFEDLFVSGLCGPPPSEPEIEIEFCMSDNSSISHNVPSTIIESSKISDPDSIMEFSEMPSSMKINDLWEATEVLLHSDIQMLSAGALQSNENFNLDDTTESSIPEDQCEGPGGQPAVFNVTVNAYFLLLWFESPKTGTQVFFANIAIAWCNETLPWCNLIEIHWTTDVIYMIQAWLSCLTMTPEFWSICVDQFVQIRCSGSCYFCNFNSQQHRRTHEIQKISKLMDCFPCLVVPAMWFFDFLDLLILRNATAPLILITMPVSYHTEAISRKIVSDLLKVQPTVFCNHGAFLVYSILFSESRAESECCVEWWAGTGPQHRK